MTDLTTQEQLCLSVADMGQAVIQAHEAGVPLRKALMVLDQLKGEMYVHDATKRLIITIYQMPRTGATVPNVDQIAVKCMEDVGPARP